MSKGHVRFCKPTLLGRPHQSIGSFMFEPEGGDLIELKLAAGSYFCPDCETVVMPGVHEGLKCYECGKAISEDDDACPSCGWSWK